MKYKSINSRFIVVFSIILAAALLRLMPHWPNFTPIAAMALFAGTYVDRKRFAFAIPIAAMLLSDLVIGLHSIMPAVYISFAITVLIGMHLRNKVGVGMVVFASLSSSVIFFLITNFAAWQASPIWPRRRNSTLSERAWIRIGQCASRFFQTHTATEGTCWKRLPASRLWI